MNLARHWISFAPDGSKITLGLMTDKRRRVEVIREARHQPLWIRHAAKIQRNGWVDLDSIPKLSYHCLVLFLNSVNEASFGTNSETNFQLETRLYLDHGRSRLQVAIVGG